MNENGHLPSQAPQSAPSSFNQQPGAEPPQVKWFHQKWFVILMVIFVFPVGLILLWTSPATKLSGRVVWSLVVALALLIRMGSDGGAPSPANETGSSPKPAAAVSQVEPAPKASAPAPAKSREPKWNTSDLDATTNGNLLEAVTLLQTKEPNWLTSNADATAQPGLVMKTPWKFYGKPTAFQGEVGIVQAYPPGSDVGRVFGGEVAEVVMVTDDGTIIDFMMMGDSGSTQVGHVITVYGLVVGQVEVNNKMGGQTTQLMVVGNAIQGN